MLSGDEIEQEICGMSDASTSAVHARQKLEFAWLQVRMCWQSGGKTRLDQEKKDAIATLIQLYREAREPDRPQREFEQVLLRLQEEHALRLKELGRDERRALKVQNNPIQVVRDNNSTWLQVSRDKTEETPPIIAEWQQLMDLLF